MHNNQSSYERWTWIVALILALTLLLMVITGHGPSSQNCCVTTASDGVATETTNAKDRMSIPASTEFGFSATEKDFTHTGDASALAWYNNVDALKALLAGGNALQAEGSDKRVKLTGSVESNAQQQQKGTDAQAFFGSDVVVDNQITVEPMAVTPVVEAEPASAVTAEPAAIAAPSAAKLYFRTASSHLAADAVTTLAPIVDWLKTHPDAKAVISGFHDPAGNPERNIELAKKRALATLAALKAAGIDESKIMARPPVSTDGGTDLVEARRVEVSIE